MDDFGELLRAALEDGKPSTKKLESQKEAKAILSEFLSTERDFEVGDYVQRNKFGKQRYKLPKGNEVGQVVHIREHNYDTPSAHSEVGNNVVLAVVVAKDEVHLLEADGRFYQKAVENENVTFFDKFKKGK